MNEETEHIYPTIGRHVEGLSAPVLTGLPREEIIRCPDCKKRIEGEKRNGCEYCRAFHGWYACEGGFCHFAERKEKGA
ncbi:MAG: hypothetical protein IJR41_06280 [Atopobiaceae bacterium]|nr:hypothetical protein [Atopobiaceae bacterium]